MQEYVTGLPELLARSQAEKKSGLGGGGGGGMTGSNLTDYQAIFNYLLGGNTKPLYTEPYSATMNAMRSRSPRPGTAVAPTYQRTTNADRFE
jgi:hypothetical protein